MPSLYAHNFHICDARFSTGRAKNPFFDIVSLLYKPYLVDSSQVTNWDRPDLVPCPKEQSCPQRAVMSVRREPYFPRHRYKDCFQETFGGGHSWTAQMKARSCCRSHASTVRVASTLSGLWGSVPLCHVNAEQQVTGIPLLPAPKPGR